jgi:hypothetical protein
MQSLAPRLLQRCNVIFVLCQGTAISIYVRCPQCSSNHAFPHAGRRLHNGFALLIPHRAGLLTFSIMKHFVRNELEVRPQWSKSGLPLGIAY